MTCDQLLQELYLKEEIRVSDILFSSECIARLEEEGLILFNDDRYSITRLGKIAYGMGGVDEYCNYFNSEKPDAVDLIMWSLTRRFFTFRTIFYSVMAFYLLLIALVVLYFWSSYF